ncbi:uncharacterized protein LOC119114068 [Pollicipes pollicipes]|uniref:uncharacterized protein LOC119114068 n=1 Tax=Pollicipes pollicipes TaxID=41117 RepID=UPI00188537C6|nr:uncharacterized protein LOC119114068 [Pollicipes pollicipes]
MRGVQGAALRRQRSRLEAQQRRGTSLSLEGATEQLRRPSTQSLAQPSGLIWGITLFHIGLVFLVIGFLMVITAMIPGYMEKAEAYDLVGTGTFFVVLGGVLTLINRVITRREEDSLGKYVTGRLARSRSGGRLAKDANGARAPAAGNDGAQKTAAPKV